MGCGARRNPPRPPEQRQKDYEETFDFDTLIFDAVAIPEDHKAVLICPPGLNLAPLWQGATLRSPIGETLPFVFEELDRMARITIDGVSPGEALELHFGGGDVVLQPANGAELFSGRKVLMTLSRDNDLTWIADWAEYYAAVHGIDAVLFFDNRSSSYGPDAIERVLIGVRGVEVAVVVDWPAPYGPQANKGWGWDSDFGQHGMLEVARWRFLRHASLAINADVDELVLPDRGFSLTTACAASDAAAVAYRCLWTVRDPSLPLPPTLRHRDCDLVEPSDNPRQSMKWAVDPVRSRNVRQWNVHRLDGISIDAIHTNRAETRHFRHISTGWKSAHRKLPRELLPGTFRDERLIEVFNEIGWRS